MSLQPSMADRMLVTGASGFVGSEVVAHAARSGTFTVRAASRREHSVPQGVEVARVGDLGPGTDWAAALDGVTHVVHCAGRAHVLKDHAHDPAAAYHAANAAGTLALARAAAARGVRRFVFISTIKVNGGATPMDAPYTEADAPAPEDDYGRSKLAAEQGLMALANETSMSVTIIRPTLVYGPGVRGNFEQMMKWIARGIPLPFGSVDNRRSMVGRANLVDLIMTCLDHPAAAQQTFLASDIDLPTPQLLRDVGVALGRRARLVPIPSQILSAAAKLVGAGGAASRLLGSLRVDNSKARRLLEWHPVVSFHTELERTAQHFLQSRAA
jgi:nucleoside-diphosphate-sugar epimerase